MFINHFPKGASHESTQQFDTCGHHATSALLSCSCSSSLWPTKCWGWEEATHATAHQEDSWVCTWGLAPIFKTHNAGYFQRQEGLPSSETPVSFGPWSNSAGFENLTEISLSNILYYNPQFPNNRGVKLRRLKKNRQHIVLFTLPCNFFSCTIPMENTFLL